MGDPYKRQKTYESREFFRQKHLREMSDDQIREKNDEFFHRAALKNPALETYEYWSEEAPEDDPEEDPLKDAERDPDSKDSNGNQKMNSS